MEIRTYVENICREAKAASPRLALASTEEKNKLIAAFADELLENTAYIIEENDEDIKAARENGLSEAMCDRLRLDEKRIGGIVNALRDLISLPDPCGRGTVSRRPNGLDIECVSVPLGCVGVIYEARPNVSADIAGLCLKSGNACVLRGGKEAIHSNKAIVNCAHRALEKCGYPTALVSLVEMTEREGASVMMEMRGTLDVLIPRGGKGLIQHVVTSSKVPVIETGAGNCHIYIHRDCNVKKAVSVAKNAKMSRPSVCNAVETILVHADIAETVLPLLSDALEGCEIRGCEKTMQYISCTPATSEDWEKEYNDYIAAVKVVSSIDEAIDHINHYSTGHSEAIMTRSIAAANEFTARVDSACVYVNASTRFTDGGEFGLGAEVGISTQKLHARGPMGLTALTTTKYIVRGDGQIR
jgi:glutamate-5-semialdehyde dehydrogenase